ncbi:MAG: pantoate--beta-alanine ligase [Armatimonadetes bacterium]|nr:pantoate--beta-alanine ligase [Armatimonadota bacterium]
MKLVHTIKETRDEITQARREGKIIGFVPTMGALHEGHLTLVKRAREECGFVVVSIFVNPTQFGPSDDLDNYPRTLESDAHKCEQAVVDLIFAPSPAEMYPRGFDTWVEVNGPAEMLEGALRPGHFRGATSVCAKLFNITNPDFTYFGKKDYQQLTVIRKMVRDLNLPMTVVPVDTVRERDGLAISSRNVYLSSVERNAALVLSRALKDVKAVFDSGERRVLTLKRIAESMIAAELMPRIDYVEIVDAETLTPIDEIERPAVLLLAVKIGSTRLIDNIELWREI